jgi:hypothetical protein
MIANYRIKQASSTQLWKLLPVFALLQEQTAIFFAERVAFKDRSMKVLDAPQHFSRGLKILADRPRIVSTLLSGIL